MDRSVKVAYHPVMVPVGVQVPSIQPRRYTARGADRIVNPMYLVAPLVRLQLGAHLDKQIGINVL